MAYRDLAGDPIRLMDHLGIKRAHLVGYSLGGGIVARAAVTHPDRLITAVLGGHSGYRDWQPESANTHEAAARELESDVPFRSIAPLMLPGVANPTEEQIRAASASLAAENDVKALAAVRRGGFRPLYNTIAEAAGIRVPFLMVYGSLDSVRSGKAMQEILPSAQLVVVDGATHGTTARRPEFIAAVRQFIAAHR
jgi:pimeloyl-ACP methyl ester carboxylesterase